MAAAALLLTLGGALFCRPAKHTQRVFRIGMNNLQPWIQADANGKASGLVVDLLSEAARRTGIRLEWSLVEGSSPGEAFAEGRVDMWPVVGVLEERRKMFHLTEPWLTSSFALVSREESPALTPSDVRGRTVAVTGVPISMKLAREFIGTADLNRVRGRKKVLTEVCEGKAYAGFEEASYLHSMLMKRPEPCFGVPLAVHLVRGAASSVAIASRREAAETADTLRSALDDMAADGAMGAVLDRWAPFSATEIRSMFALRELHERRSRLQWGIGISLGIACLLGWQMRRATLAAQRERLANSAKSEFLANMSHEIRTPMNGVLGMIDLVLSRPINEESRADLMVVRESGAALLAILTDILDLAK
ncbi:MAG TPA: transporter substrate-binding domain-containing protein, partial [Bryobacteraceae bacterium]|nr:transporter substrate-binding domain-containing protein [Bryobacteraceae bacterium]